MAPELGHTFSTWSIQPFLQASYSWGG